MQHGRIIWAREDQLNKVDSVDNAGTCTFMHDNSCDSKHDLRQLAGWLTSPACRMMSSRLHSHRMLCLQRCAGSSAAAWPAVGGSLLRLCAQCLCLGTHLETQRPPGTLLLLVSGCLHIGVAVGRLALLDVHSMQHAIPIEPTPKGKAAVFPLYLQISPVSSVPS